MKITKINIEHFRGFSKQEFEAGSQITAIAGQNGTQKSTLLGIITQTFTISGSNPMSGESPLCGGNYRSAFSDKFRLSPVFDKPKEHKWTLFFDDRQEFEVESIKRSDDANVRFWQKGNKGRGGGYIQYPTIFLSLKRLIPIAEEKTITTNDTLLTEEEIKKIKELHNQILIVKTPITATTGISSVNKQSVGITTGLYDWNENSAGQDNLSKIILALFSFQRLKNKYEKEYKGGIWAIDELDATMYPASQEELLKVLRKYASLLNLQIFFTTHSLSLLEAVDKLRQETNQKTETANQIKIVYLKRIDDQISINNNITYKNICLNLKVAVALRQNQSYKITTYVEDRETALFVKSLLKGQSRYLDIIDATLSCTVLIDLVSRKVPAFSFPQSIVFLDGDVRQAPQSLKKLKEANNVLLLPGTESPERMVAKYLYNLSDTDILWENIADGYTKQFCFRTTSYGVISTDRVKAKEWFNAQLAYWGRGGNKVLNPFFSSIEKEVDNFKREFNILLDNYGIKNRYHHE